MKEKNTPPNQEELEELLRGIQPIPSAHFYQKMANQPWNKPGRLPFLNRLSKPRLAVGLTFLLVLGLTLILAAPSMNALASRIAQFFTTAPDDTMSIQLPVLEFPDPETAFYTSIGEAARQASFEVKVPSRLPTTFVFTGAAYHPIRQTVTINYESSDGSILRITQRPASLEYQSISVNAKVEQVKVGDEDGEYVTGGWRTSQPEETSTSLTVTVQAIWDPHANIHFLRWQEEDILFEILFSGADLDAASTLDKNDLIEIAENLR